jgi:membrane protease subunit HflK
MAWNTPGGRQQGRQGDGFGWVPRPIRDLFGGDGGRAGPWPWLLVPVLLWLAFTSFVLVGEQQRGVVLRFGKEVRVMQPGPNFKLPWPIERVVKVNATGIQTYEDTIPVLTRDENIVRVSLNVQYQANDPVIYLFGSRGADKILQQAAQSAVREVVGQSDLDTVLGARGALAVTARDTLQRMLNEYRTGLLVTQLNLQDARPPEEVKPAFDDVNSAQQDKDRRISEARAYAASVVPEARGAAARVRSLAEADKATAVARAQGDTARFQQLLPAYKAAPEVTRERLWLDTVQQVLRDNRTVIGDGRQLIYLPMPATTAAPAGAANTPADPPGGVAPMAAAIDAARPSNLIERPQERPARPASRGQFEEGQP